MGIKINSSFKAKTISYDYSKKRSLANIKYIVIHYTENANDTAESNAKFYANTNIRKAGTHFFVDKLGKIYKSIDMNRTAWAVGGARYSAECREGGGRFSNVCFNSNSVSIELCDCMKNPSYEQMLAVRNLVKYIQSKCPNARAIIRHWDVNGKPCPASMKGLNNPRWNKLHSFINGHYAGNATVTKKAVLRAKAKVNSKKLMTIPVGEIVAVKTQTGNWAKVLYKGVYGYISLNKITL